MPHEPEYVASEEAAIITKNGLQNMDLLIPDVEPIPELVQYLMACHFRYFLDKEFVREQLAWLKTLFKE